MLEPIHLEYALTGHRTACCKREEFFKLLDCFDSAARHELLTPVYLAFEVSFEQEGSKKEIQEKRYDEFKRVFLSMNSRCKEDEYVVFGLVSFLLAEVARKIDVARFDRIIGDKRFLLACSRIKRNGPQVTPGKKSASLWTLSRVCTLKLKRAVRYSAYFAKVSSGRSCDGVCKDRIHSP